MGREACVHVGPRFVAVGLATVLALGSSVAMADESVRSDEGLLKFANVRVVDAPAPAASVNPTQAGYRVYKDSATGQLRAPTAEEMQAAAAERPERSANIRMSRTANGASRVVLDESFMQYSMAVRQADGSIAEVCVTGADKANDVIDQAMSPSAASASVKEARNVR